MKLCKKKIVKLARVSVIFITLTISFVAMFFVAVSGWLLSLISNFYSPGLVLLGRVSDSRQ